MRLTAKRAELIDALRPEGRYLMNRDSKTLAPSVRSVLRGSHVIELVAEGRESSITRTHMNIALEMLEAGILEACGERPLGGKLYQLTEKGRAIDTRFPDSRRSDQPRVLKSDIERLAHERGCRVRFVRGHYRWVLSLVASKQAKPLKYDVLLKENGEPAVRTSDLTLQEWDEAIKRCLILNGEAVE